MGPTILCDKSILQRLTHSELNVLRRYYSLNVPPILCVEIRGDLAKSEERGGGRRGVQSLARRLVPVCVKVNTSFRDLVVQELRGCKVAMDGRPVISGGRTVKSEAGKMGIVFEESATEKVLHRWQDGQFAEAEEALSQIWRESTESVDLAAWARKLRAQYSHTINLGSISAVTTFVDGLIAQAASSVIRSISLFGWLFSEYAFGREAQAEALNRLIVSELSQFPKIYPYATYCLRAALTFHFALAFGLVTTKANTTVDFEYLFYLPFCNVFSSGDKFHRLMANQLMRKDQTFVWGDELQADFNKFCLWWASLNEAEQREEQQRVGPLPDESSVTHRVWQKYMLAGYRERRTLFETMTDEQREALSKQLPMPRKHVGAPNENMPAEMKDLDFVSIEHRVKRDGPCFCGSNRKFQECHGRGL